MFLRNEQEREDYLRFVTQAVRVTTHDGYLKLLNSELKVILPFGSAISGFGYITPKQTVQAHKLIPLDFPVEYLNAIATPDGGIISPKMTNWIRTRLPQLFEDEPESLAGVPAEWVEILRRYGLKNMMSHGVHDLKGRCSSYFVFANVPERLNKRHCAILETVVPMLHAVLVKIADNVPHLAIQTPSRFD